MPEEEVKAEEAKEESAFLAGYNKVERAVNSFAWGPVMLVLLVGTGIFYTIRTGAFQFTKIGHVLKNTIGKVLKKKDKKEKTKAKTGEVTPFQALTTAMAATVGTGNIAGVTGAIVLGGPGAVFWMWVSALFGMATKFAEVVLAIKYREKNAKGEWVGGPMYYIKNGLGKNWKWLAAIFAVLGVLASFGIGNAAQASSIASTFITAANAVTSANILGTQTESVLRLVIGIIVAVVVGIVLIGGVKRIGKVTETIVPFMSMFYIIGSLIIVFANIGNIGPVFASIFKAAFAPRAVIGGVGGFVFMNAVKRGVGRGVFSNEAGLGSAPIAHSSSSETHPVKQGLYGIFEVFVDTVIICTLTTLVVLMSGITIPWGNGAMADAQVTIMAFSSVFGSKFSSIFMAVAMLFFALSTILAWSLYGQRCLEYITKGKGRIIYLIVFLLVIIYGSTADITLIWNLSDTMNGLMAIPNLIALIALSGVVASAVKEYRKQLKDPKPDKIVDLK
ncbi:MAG: sodium:alanine symporter family protein [Christensenellaceae bacterium]|nr:sodium:alanine symporter family protein [Christensenellaceae bacterium]